MATALGLLLALAAVPRPCPAGLSSLPWSGWLGGLRGATYVGSRWSLYPGDRLAATIALTVAGQQLISVLVQLG